MVKYGINIYRKGKPAKVLEANSFQELVRVLEPYRRAAIGVYAFDTTGRFTGEYASVKYFVDMGFEHLAKSLGKIQELERLLEEARNENARLKAALRTPVRDLSDTDLAHWWNQPD